LRAIHRQLDIFQRLSGHLLVRFNLPKRQIAGGHTHDLLALHFSSHRIVGDLSDFMFSVLVELCSKQIVAVIVVRVLRKRKLNRRERAS